MLPCKTEKTKNIILEHDITNIIASNISQFHRNGQGSCAFIYLFGVLCSNVCMKQRFMTLTTSKNTWCKLGLTLNRTLLMLQLTSGVTAWDHACMLVADTFNTCSEMNVHSYDSWKYFMKLLAKQNTSVYFTLLTVYNCIQYLSWFNF